MENLVSIFDIVLTLIDMKGDSIRINGNQGRLLCLIVNFASTSRYRLEYTLPIRSQTH